MSSMIVETKYGKIQGVKEDGCVLFKGVPYAMAPIGQLRFKAPQPPKPWEGVFVADSFGCRSPQIEVNTPDTFYGKEFYQEEVFATPISEDSLYLNIWVPEDALDSEEKAEENTSVQDKPLLPVAFYIHGGAFMGGCGHELEFRTGAYGKEGVILVTINYRLGLFGFLAHPWLEAEDDAACGNYGIMDQIAALTWVKENIRAFGGDPDNITIFGQSAGCMSVQTLLSTPYAKGKFAKAILQSGAGYPVIIQKDVTLEQAFEYGEMVVKKAGVSSLEELRAVSMEDLLKIQDEIVGELMASGKGLAFCPVLNGKFRTMTYEAAIENGAVANVPTMIGSTKNDITVTPEEAQSQHSRLRESCKGWAFQMEKLGHKPSYVYYFKRDLPGDDAGAFHSSELWYMFGTLKECWRPLTEADDCLAETMVSYWTNFMKNGSPEGPGLKLWPPCTKEDPFEMIFDI